MAELITTGRKPAAARALRARPLRPRAAAARLRRTSGDGRMAERTRPGRDHRLRQHRHRPDDQGRAAAPLLELVGMAGIDPDSAGLRQGAATGVTATTHEGLDGPARAGRRRRPRLRRDLGRRPRRARPAPRRARDRQRRPDPGRARPGSGPAGQPGGPRRRPRRQPVTCGAQATVPIVAAICGVDRGAATPRSSRRSPSRSAGPGTRANIDEFTRSTARALEHGRRRREAARRSCCSTRPTRRS